MIPWHRPIRAAPLWWLLPVAIAIVIAACSTDDGNGQAGDAAGTTPTAAPTSTTPSAAPAAGDEATPTAERSSREDASPPSSETVPPVVYDGDFSTSVGPILAEKCASCHAPGGPGTAHWELSTAADAADNHVALAEIVEAGAMPPWPAGGSSPAFLGDRSLRADQLRAVLDWAEAGGELDVEPTIAIEPVAGVVGLDDPDRTLIPAEAYAGSVATADDYRCQIYDPQLPDGGWITAYEFAPDQTEVVHHAIGYLIPAEARDRALARDGEDGRPGWSCYGSSGLGEDELFLGWAPGQDPSELPDGTGLWVEPGALIVIQIHYHYETDAPADRSALALRLAPAGPGADLDAIEIASLVAPAEIPCSEREDGPLCDRDNAIRAAEQKYGPEGVQADGILQICQASVEDFAAMTGGTASSSCDIPAVFVGAVGEVVSVLGHQHEIGAWIRLTINPGRVDERVLLDIPDWDFDWQYNYRPVERIVIEPTDVIRVECGWDRARRDPRLEPAYVLWADGTDDEMCFATITTRPATT